MALGLLALLSAIAQAPTDLWSLQEGLRHVLETISQLGPWGVIAFILCYAVATVTFFPGAILTLGAGALFGLVWGSLSVFVGATLGAIAAFLIGRYLARDWVARQLTSYPRFQAIDYAVGKTGFKVVFLTRLSPLFPFNLLNYAYGVTSVTLKDYSLASLGMLPGTILYVYLGSLAGDLATLSLGDRPQPTTAGWIVNGIGLITTIIATLYITQIARKALQTVVDSTGDR